uniref:Uncharacterized protein n=1 Tax=Strombidium rassoulzadegani TaxID=1082188 RepID=A0A7S3CSB1_9SPIT|mmetsp:Transcript_6041/g.10254  ORF Transcript_6041/g.10254 Transcript_6041/m.10254 type:complete len:181 (+) Transcript_6041:514-1056(+)
MDLLQGYCAAIGSSISVAVTLRKLTAGLSRTATGTKLLLLNTMVGATAGAAASFCNTYFMRKAEMDKGIEICSDPEVSNKIGISKKCAESAVTETAASRSIMSLCCVGIPAVLILSLGAIGIRPKGTVMKNLLEINCVTMGLLYGLPISVAVFPPVSMKKGTEIEEKFHGYDKVYFNKGL